MITKKILAFALALTLTFGFCFSTYADVSGNTPTVDNSFDLFKQDAYAKMNTALYNITSASLMGNTDYAAQLMAQGVLIDAKNWQCIDLEMLRKIDALNIPVGFIFKYGQQKFFTIITPGSTSQALIDPSGYVGFLKLASRYGATPIL